MAYDDMEQHAKADRVKRQEQDHHDLQREIAGVQGGRQERFMVSGEPSTAQQAKKEREQVHTLTALELLLQSPEYVKLYQETSAFVMKAATVTEEALQQTNMDLQALYKIEEEQLRNANRLADGTVVFEDKHGDVFTQEGTIVRDTVALDGIVHKENATSYEDYRTNQDKIEATNDKIEVLTHYQNDVIGTAQDRLADEDNPLSKEELQQMKKDLYEQAPAMIQEQLQPSADVKPVEQVSGFNQAIPTL